MTEKHSASQSNPPASATGVIAHGTPVSLARLAHISGGTIHNAAAAGAGTAGEPDAEQLLVSDISLNSGAVPEGGLFAALPGTRVHGAVYAGSSPAGAILSDAAGVALLKEAGEQRPIVEVADIRKILGLVSAEIYAHPADELTIIGITGTSGKTTTSYLVESCLTAAGFSVGTIGTTGTRINGRPLATELTTPEAPTLQAIFRRMRSEGVTHVVMEVSSHALALGRITGTRFAVRAFSNLSQDHLDFHRTMEEYFETKASFFNPEYAARQAQGGHSAAVINIDDQWGLRLAQRLAADPGDLKLSTIEVPQLSGAQDRAAELPAAGASTSTIEVAEIHPDGRGGQSFAIRRDGESAQVEVPLPGYFNAANAAMAIRCAELVGVSGQQARAAVAAVKVPGRMEAVDSGQEFLAVVDYAHKPAALAAILDTLREQTSGRLGVVVGAGGDRDTAKRPIMGAEAARRADLVIVTDDNPRSEDPAAIRAEVMRGATAAAQELAQAPELQEIGDRAAAIRAAVRWAEPADAIVIAGKGHETGQLIAGVKHHFDDREELRAALAELSGSANHPEAGTR